MSDSTRSVVLLILILILLIALAFVGSNLMMRRAVKAVLRMFRSDQALSAETARTLEELGFKNRSFLQFRAFRDYKPAALQLLMKNNIIQSTEDGRVFLSEEALSKTNLGQQGY